MIYTYENYQGARLGISFEECLKLHRQMTEAIGQDEDGIEIYDELLEKAAEYARYRVLWTTRPREWKMEKDDARTAKHNSLIVKFNMLARYLQTIDRDTTWRDILGYEEEEPYARKRIGDFACFLVYIHGINGR